MLGDGVKAQVVKTGVRLLSLTLVHQAPNSLSESQRPGRLQISTRDALCQVVVGQIHG